VIDNKFNAIWGLTRLDNIENLTLKRYVDRNFFIHFAGRVDYHKIKYVH
jgi:hypothetical protein